MRVSLGMHLTSRRNTEGDYVNNVEVIRHTWDRNLYLGNRERPHALTPELAVGALEHAERRHEKRQNITYGAMAVAVGVGAIVAAFVPAIAGVALGAAVLCGAAGVAYLRERYDEVRGATVVRDASRLTAALKDAGTRRHCAEFEDVTRMVQRFMRVRWTEAREDAAVALANAWNDVA